MRNIGHPRPPAIGFCFALFLLRHAMTCWCFLTRPLYPAARCFLDAQSSSSLGGSIAGLGVWCWNVFSSECDQSSATSPVWSERPEAFVQLSFTGHCWWSFLAILYWKWRHVLWKIWSFCMDAFVVLHVSDPYNNTDLTLELKICSLVEIRMSLEAQICLAW